MEFVFKVFQLADFLAGLLVLREALPLLATSLRRQRTTTPNWLLGIGGLGIGLIPILAFWRRLFDSAVLWLGFDPFTPATALTAIILLFAVLFWAHHILLSTTARIQGQDKRAKQRTWLVQHQIMGIVLGISILSTYFEMLW